LGISIVTGTGFGGFFQFIIQFPIQKPVEERAIAPLSFFRPACVFAIEYAIFI
jgi:hypothetical protein